MQALLRCCRAEEEEGGEEEEGSEKGSVGPADEAARGRKLKEDVAEARRRARKAQVLTVLSLVGIYIVWLVMVYIIFGETSPDPRPPVSPAGACHMVFGCGEVKPAAVHAPGASAAVLRLTAGAAAIARSQCTGWSSTTCWERMRRCRSPGRGACRTGWTRRSSGGRAWPPADAAGLPCLLACLWPCIATATRRLLRAQQVSRFSLFTSSVRPRTKPAPLPLQDVFKSAIQGAAILLILDQLRLVPVSKWLERHLDVLSVQATLLRENADEGRVGYWQRVLTYKNYMGRVGGD